MPDTPEPPSRLVYQLRISLRGVRPPVWRRVLVPPETTYADLHHIIQVLFGWCGEHRHEFEPGFDWYSRRGGRTLAEKDYEPGDTFEYVYDPDDYDPDEGWSHRIAVEMVRVSADLALPVCTGGKRAAPPEDGFDDSGPDASGDPEAFDLKRTNEELEPLRVRLARRAAKAAKAASSRKAGGPLPAAPGDVASTADTSSFTLRRPGWRALRAGSLEPAESESPAELDAAVLKDPGRGPAPSGRLDGFGRQERLHE